LPYFHGLFGAGYAGVVLVSAAAAARYCPAVAEESAGAVAAGAASLPDRIALGVLTRLFTRELTPEPLAERLRARAAILRAHAEQHHQTRITAQENPR
jgi:hypothetical protein